MKQIKVCFNTGKWGRHRGLLFNTLENVIMLLKLEEGTQFSKQKFLIILNKNITKNKYGVLGRLSPDLPAKEITRGEALQRMDRKVIYK